MKKEKKAMTLEIKKKTAKKKNKLYGKKILNRKVKYWLDHDSTSFP